MNAPSSVEDTAESAVGTLPLSPGRRLGEFQITRVVGQGGFGIVYEAEDLALQRRIAIREYMPSQLATRIDGVRVQPISARYAKTFELGRKSFIAEARLLAQFRHPGLLAVLHFWSQNGTAYMAMPFYEGRTLDKVVARRRRVISEKWLGTMIRPVLDALEHMHGEDCHHRDVSPDNILIREDGRALLLDLGAARHVIGDRERALTMMLKHGYAPIEQYADDAAGRLGPWTDIYAVAAVLYFAVTAKAPPASASRVTHDSLTPLATLRPAGYGLRFLEAIDRGLSIRPENRPRNVGEFRSLLFEVTPGEARERRTGGAAPVPDAARAESAKAAVRGHEASSTPRKRSAPLAAAAAIVCAVLVAWMAWPTSRSAASGDAGDAALVQRDDAAPAPRNDAASVPRAAEAGAVEPVVSKPANGVARPVIAAPSRSVAGKTPPRVAASSQKRPPARAASPTAAQRSTSDVSSTNSAKAAEGATNAPEQAGTLRLSVAPWGEVFVDGASRGVTPPLKQIVLSAGRHQIEIRNPAGPSWSEEIVVRAGKQETVSHRFQ